MYINGSDLLAAAPIKNMLRTKERNNGVSHGLSEAGYDIQIQQEVKFTYTSKGNPMVEVNNPDGSIDSTWRGRFALASAVEEFQMPNNLVAFVKDKSTWARQGISVFNTVIEPGWNGFLTLELVYHGSSILTIPAGTGIAQVLFSELSIPTQYEGKYQNQDSGPQEARFK